MLGVTLTYGIRKEGGQRKLNSNYSVDTIALKKIMVDKGLEKIIDLSNASNIDRNTLSRVLSGDAKPSTTVIEKLMCALDIPPEKAGLIFFNSNLRNT